MTALTIPIQPMTVAATGVIKVMWAVYSTDDDGRQRDLVGIYSNTDHATLAARGQGAWGSDGKILEVFAVTRAASDEPPLVAPLLGKEWVPLDVNIPQAVREAKAAALAKLTSVERRLLGLPD